MTPFNGSHATSHAAEIDEVLLCHICPSIPKAIVEESLTMKLTVEYLSQDFDSVEDRESGKLCLKRVTVCSCRCHKLGRCETRYSPGDTYIGIDCFL
jgi:hypothetical protein